MNVQSLRMDSNSVRMPNPREHIHTPREQLEQNDAFYSFKTPISFHGFRKLSVSFVKKQLLYISSKAILLNTSSTFDHKN